jgi:hypothetical protein
MLAGDSIRVPGHVRVWDIDGSASIWEDDIRAGRGSSQTTRNFPTGG